MQWFQPQAPVSTEPKLTLSSKVMNFVRAMHKLGLELTKPVDQNDYKDLCYGDFYCPEPKDEQEQDSDGDLAYGEVPPELKTKKKKATGRKAKK